MKHLILHLSDIHIGSEHDPILQRAQNVVEAVRNVDYALDSIALVISGDVAFSGTEEQYLLALDFVESICRDLKTYASGSADVPCIAVPGNHDCDFTVSTPVRDAVLRTLADEPTKLENPDIVQVCTQVQGSFFDFVQATAGPSLDLKNRLCYEYSVRVGDDTLQFRCYNTAVTSRREEKPGTLLCAPCPPREGANDASVVISVLHHPYNWLIPAQARSLRREIERTSDIVLTGHEHEHTRRVDHVATGEMNEFIEGGVLQESGGRGMSAFNVLVIDTADQQQRFYHFVWRDGRYVPSVSHEQWEPFPINRLRTKKLFEPVEQMQDFLDDPELTLTHRVKGRLGLSDIYVAPDLREVSHAGEQLALIHGDTVVDRVVEAGTVLVTGSEQSGKTALAKRSFIEFRRKGYVPLYVTCKELRPQSADQLYEALYRLAEEQYGEEVREPYRQLEKQRRVLIVDDLQSIKASRAMRRSLLETLRRFAGYVLLLADDLELQISEVVRHPAAPAKRYRIQQFGHVLRNQLVEKWFLLGDPDGEQEEFVHTLARVEETLDTVLGRNFVPAFPVFILAVLQGTEAATPIDLRASTHGYFYELLIRAALATGETRQSFDISTSYLAFIAYRLFVTRRRDLALEELAAIHQEYGDLYQLKRPLKSALDHLTARQILQERGGRFSFKYNYIYYYFVASYVRDHITESECRDRVSYLAERVYVEENANILLFLAHLSRDPFIIHEMLREAGRVYSDWQPATLEGDVEFIRALVSPNLTPEYVETDPSAARREMLQNLDDREAANAVAEPTVDPNLEPAAALLDPVMRLNIALKTQQILGQILKNFPGSLEGPMKMRIAQECSGLGLRALSAILDLIRRQQEAIVGDLTKLLALDHASWTTQALAKRARQTLGGMAYLIAHGLIKKISYAIGSPDLTETYAKLLPPEASTAQALVDVSIRFDHLAGFPERETIDLADRLSNNPFGGSLLQHLVVQRFYLFPSDWKLKQRVCGRLGIPYRTIQVMNPAKKLIPPEKRDTGSGS